MHQEAILARSKVQIFSRRALTRAHKRSMITLPNLPRAPAQHCRTQLLTSAHSAFFDTPPLLWGLCGDFVGTLWRLCGGGGVSKFANSCVCTSPMTKILLPLSQGLMYSIALQNAKLCPVIKLCRASVRGKFNTFMLHVARAQKKKCF